MSEALRIALIGLGNVGRGLLRILHDKADSLRDQYGLSVQVVGVVTGSRGALYHPDGLDLPTLLKVGTLREYPDSDGLIRDTNALTLATHAGIDVLIEASPTDLQTGQPALDTIRAAINAGKHVITANKGPVALAFAELSELARAKNVYFGYEGTVMGGTPAIRTARLALAGCTIREVRGILNGTTNFILTEMEMGASYDDALADAQKRGYAETDPTGDVEGYDAMGKLQIVAQIILGVKVDPAQIERVGITGLTGEQVRGAVANSKRYKLIARIAVGDNGTIVASVKPELLPDSDALAGINGVYNALSYVTDLLGTVTLIGPGAGDVETGFALLSDLLELHRFHR